MSRINLGFSAGQVAPNFGGAMGLPVGRHRVIITKFNQKATKANDGGILEVCLQAIEGESNGLTKIDNLNVFNKNPTTVEIAIRRLSAYCHVVNRPDWNDQQNELEELCNIPFYVDIVEQKENPKYTEVNEIIPDNQGAAAQSQPQPAQQQQPAAAGWGNQPAQNQPEAAQATQQPAWGNPSQPAGTAFTAPAGGAQQPAWTRK